MNKKLKIALITGGAVAATGGGGQVTATELRDEEGSYEVEVTRTDGTPCGWRDRRSSTP